MRYVDIKRKMQCVYIYLDADSRPYYVGHGSMRRPRASHAHVQVPSDRNKILICPAPTKAEAAKLEQLLIARWGRKSSGGFLLNRTRGGTGLREPTAETRAKLSAASKGAKRTEQWLQRQIESNDYRALRQAWLTPEMEMVMTHPREILRNHPEQQLDERSLFRVRNGVYAHHRGWRLAVPKRLTPKKSKGELRIWKDPEDKLVIGCNMDIASRYGLCRHKLSLVARGHRNHHRGWRFVSVAIPIPLAPAA